MNNLIGKTLKGKYLIRRSLGDGGHGEVFLADDQKLRRQVAVKRLRSPYFSSQINARFKQEAHIMADFKHPNIVPIFENFEEDGRLYLVMEYCEAGSLKDFLAPNGSLAMQEVIELGKSVARALQAAHSKGIIHRDVKPGNILFSQNGEGFIVKLTDFGIAHQASQQEPLTQTGDVLGTPLYFAPEQTTGRAVTKTDIYALGVLLYGLLAGQHYLDLNGDMFENRSRIVKETPRPLRELRPDVPAWLNHLIMQSLSKTASERPSAVQFYARLQTEGGTDRLTQTPKIQDTSPAFTPRHSWLQKGLVAVITWAVVAVVLVLGYQAYRSEERPLLPAVPYQPTPTETVLTTTVRSEIGFVNVRAAPDVAAEMVGQLTDGITVTLQTRDETGTWFYLTSEELTGWMFGDYLTPVDGQNDLPLIVPADKVAAEIASGESGEDSALDEPDPTPMPTRTPETYPSVFVGNTAPADGLRLRRGPSQEETVLAILPDGTQVSLLAWSDDGQWAQVDEGQNQGWVFASYLQDTMP